MYVKLLLLTFEPNPNKDFQKMEMEQLAQRYFNTLTEALDLPETDRLLLTGINERTRASFFVVAFYLEVKQEAWFSIVERMRDEADDALRNDFSGGTSMMTLAQNVSEHRELIERMAHQLPAILPKGRAALGELPPALQATDDYVLFESLAALAV